MLKIKSNRAARTLWLALPPAQLLLALVMIGLCVFTPFRHDVARFHPVALGLLTLAVVFAVRGSCETYHVFLAATGARSRRPKSPVFGRKQGSSPTFQSSVLSALSVGNKPNIACVANARTLALVRFRAPTRYIKRRDVARFDFETRMLHLNDGSRIDISCPGMGSHRYERAFLSPLYTLWYGETAIWSGARRVIRVPPTPKDS